MKEVIITVGSTHPLVVSMQTVSGEPKCVVVSKFYVMTDDKKYTVTELLSLQGPIIQLNSQP